MKDELSPKIKKARINAGLSQETLAKRLNVNSQDISNWENGKAEPDSTTLKQIAQKLSISPVGLFGGPARTGSVFVKRFSHSWIIYAGILFCISVLVHVYMQNKIDFYKAEHYSYFIYYVSLSKIRTCTLAFSIGMFFSCILRAFFLIKFSSKTKKFVIIVAAVTGFLTVYNCLQWMLYLCMTEEVVQLPMRIIILSSWWQILVCISALVFGFTITLLFKQCRRKLE